MLLKAVEYKLKCIKLNITNKSIIIRLTCILLTNLGHMTVPQATWENIPPEGLLIQRRIDTS